MKTVRITPDGAVPIPAEICERHGIREGTAMAIEERGDEIILTPLKAYFDKLAGILKDGPSLSQELIREHAEAREEEDRSR